LLTKLFPPILDMGNGFEELKSDIFSIQEVIDREIPFYHIQPFIYNICVYMTFKYRDIEVYLYLEGGAPPFEEDVSHVGSHRRICAKLSIISFLCCVRDSLSNILTGYPVPSSLFSLSMRGYLGMQEFFFLKRNKLETQFFVPWPRWGHALRKTRRIPLWYHWSIFYEQNRMNIDYYQMILNRE
jgi:hypothetical protein